MRFEGIRHSLVGLKLRSEFKGNDFFCCTSVGFYIFCLFSVIWNVKKRLNVFMLRHRCNKVNLTLLIGKRRKNRLFLQINFLNYFQSFILKSVSNSFLFSSLMSYHLTKRLFSDIFTTEQPSNVKNETN